MGFVLGTLSLDECRRVRAWWSWWCRGDIAPADKVTAAAPVSRLFNQPVEPRPVEITTPLDDWVSLAAPQRIEYRADVCVFGPTKRSFTARRVCPLLSAAWAMVT